VSLAQRARELRDLEERWLKTNEAEEEAEK
jgi:hypothetical protein